MSADLRDVMKHLGERLSDIEVDDMLKEADRENNGRVFYQGISISIKHFSYQFHFSFLKKILAEFVELLTK